MSDAHVATPGASGEIVASEATSNEAVVAPEESDVVPEGARVFAFDGYEKIFFKPDTKAPLIGLIRAGQSVLLADPRPLEGGSVGFCRGGFYAVQPRGYVCVGKNSTLAGDDPRVRAAAQVIADTSREMPFRVGVMISGAPQYQRVPTAEEQRANEPDLDAYLAKIASGAIAKVSKDGTLDTSKAGHGPSAAFRRYVDFAKPKLLAGDDAYLGRKMAFAREFDAEGRTFMVTPDLTLVPKDKVRFVEASKLKGVDMKNGEMKFPFGYTWIQDTPKLHKQADGEFKETGDVYPRHSFVQIEGQLTRGKGGNYWKTADGTYIRNEMVSIFKDRGVRPKGFNPKMKWIEVRITWGTLVAFEGDTPVFATAISPGVDGISQRSHGHTTKRGQYSVGWKLISADMDGVEKSKEWAVDEVPFVAYYKDSFAVHSAWWHDDFGRPKSHGCINVAPADAKWLWGWFDPGLPDGWYAAAAYQPDVRGTTIIVNP